MADVTETPTVTAVRPGRAIPGGRVVLEGSGLVSPSGDPPPLSLGALMGHVVRSSPRALAVHVPAEAPGGRLPLRIGSVAGSTLFVEIGVSLATGLHMVDSPAIGRDGTVFATYSGSRGQETAVSVYRIDAEGLRETFVTGVPNATSLAFDPEGRLHVSSRYDGTVYRVDADGHAEALATELGIACGVAFDARGVLYVGDRTGTIFRVVPGGQPEVFASIPASVAAFHLAVGPDQALYVTGPTLGTCDGVYRIDGAGKVERLAVEFGRPQGLAFDARGDLHVVEALAGASGIYRVRPGTAPELVVSGPGLVGLAFDTSGRLIAATGDTLYRFDSAPLA